MPPTTSQAVLAFFADREVRAKHNAPELLDRYTTDMEVQINVSPDGGELVPGRRNTWTAPNDSSSEQWHHVRIPKNANSEPERNDWPLRYNLAAHVEAIGCTGWDFGQRVSRWFGFDFDSIIGHAQGHGIPDEDLEAVREAAWKIPWLEIRKSTGGKGLHIYVRCCDEGIPTADHTEHAALGRAILEMIAVAANFKFEEKVDCCGGNMWIWHRKITLDNEGLKLLKPATERLAADAIPGDWRSHLPVVKKGRATQRVIGVPEEADDQFDDLVRTRKHVPFSAEHRRIIDALDGNGFTMVYQQDNHLIQTHTARLAQLMDDREFGVKGIFKTLSQGTDPGKPNCFMFPLRNGGWRVYRFTPGSKEADTWDQSGYWTNCAFNVTADLETATAAVGGYELSSGGFVIETVSRGLEALQGMGVKLSAPDWVANREMTLKPHPKSRKKLVAFVKYHDEDENSRSKQEMRTHRWVLEGNRSDTKKWTQVFALIDKGRGYNVEAKSDRLDASIRSLKTPDADDAGWRIRDADGVWVTRNRTAAKDTLDRLGFSPFVQGSVIAALQYRNWTMRNMPFQPEFPGGRVWNVGAQLAYRPTEDDRSLVHDHWDRIFEHVGKGLDEAVKHDPWCRKNGITTGALYLLHWCASLFQRPQQKLPYLFLYGKQETGKSTLHNALGLLMSKGHVEARSALLTRFNGELDGAILAVIEEVDLSDGGGTVYNRLKDLVTSDFITVNPKYVNPYKTRSYVHWIQCANDRRHCPVFEGDSRIVVIHVREKPAEDIPWPVLCEQLKEEAADFLRTLLDLQLPDEGVGRLYLPVLETEEKRQAIVDNKYDSGFGETYDREALQAAIQQLVFRHWPIYKGLVSGLQEALGPGPWSKDLGQFGIQVKEALAEAIEFGLKVERRRTANGVELTMQEHWDENNIDPEAEANDMARLEAWASGI